MATGRSERARRHGHGGDLAFPEDGWLPIAAKIRRNSELQTAQMELLMAGVTEILAGSNPRALRVRLRSMPPPGEAQLIAA